MNRLEKLRALERAVGTLIGANEGNGIRTDIAWREVRRAYAELKEPATLSVSESSSQDHPGAFLPLAERHSSDPTSPSQQGSPDLLAPIPGTACTCRMLVTGPESEGCLVHDPAQRASDASPCQYPGCHGSGTAHILECPDNPRTTKPLPVGAEFYDAVLEEANDLSQTLGQGRNYHGSGKCSSDWHDGWEACAKPVEQSLRGILAKYEACSDYPRNAVVWADEATPFDGPQVLALLKENSRLREIVEAANRLCDELWDDDCHVCMGDDGEHAEDCELVVLDAKLREPPRSETATPKLVFVHPTEAEALRSVVNAARSVRSAWSDDTRESMNVEMASLIDALEALAAVPTGGTDT